MVAFTSIILLANKSGAKKVESYIEAFTSILSQVAKKIESWMVLPAFKHEQEHWELKVNIGEKIGTKWT